MYFIMNITLRNGNLMPAIGLGTYKTRGYESVHSSLKAALSVGYKLIDTAAVYRNEADIAKAISELGVDRKELFITSKLAPKDQGAEAARRAIQESLAKLNTDYLDLYLIHWPGVQKVDPKDAQNREFRQQSWKVLEEFHARGVLKSIGVSNYEIGHLKDLLADCSTVPHVNQIEVHPHYQQRDLVKFCRENGIHVTAYSSLGTTVAVSPLLTDEKVLEIAKVKAKSPAQVLLKWGLKKGHSIIPKSTNPDHIRENFQLDFELSESEMGELDSLDRSVKYAWNANIVI